MQLKKAIDVFLTGYFSTSRLSNKTEAAYKIDLAQFLVHSGGETGVELIGVETLERWAKELETRGYAGVSIRRKFATVRVFFAYWVRMGSLNSSPLWKMRLNLARERQLPRSLTQTDTKRLLEQAWRGVEISGKPINSPADDRFLALRDLATVEVLFATGIRVGELVSLGLPDWREDEASFVVRGKGARQRMAVLPDKRSLRALRGYLIQRRAMDLPHDALLVNANGVRLSTQGVARMLTKFAAAAGIETRITPHMLRHTVATLLLRYGADIRVVQEVLGHASISTTQRYTHITKDHLLATLQAHHPNHHLKIATR